MIVSLRIMHFGFLISVIVAVLIIGIAREATAQTQIVECPCDYGLEVPKTAACWKDPFGVDSNPQYAATVQGPPPSEFCFVVHLKDDSSPPTLLALFVEAPTDGRPGVCGTTVGEIGDCGNTAVEEDLTPEEVKACQCELLAYTTALNEVAGISVIGGPPYTCFDVYCTPPPPPPPSITTPIPTLNEYGMIITAGVLGLLAVIGLFIMRTRRTVAGGSGPDGPNQ